MMNSDDLDNSVGTNIKKILFLNCDSRVVESMTGFLCEGSDSYQIFAAVADDKTTAIIAGEDIFLVTLFVADESEFPRSFLQKISAEYPQLKIILILPPDNERLRAAVPAHSCLHILTHPYEPFALVHLIKELSSHKHSHGFTGTLKIVRIEDLIQMCCLSGATITIQVNNNLQQGRIFIREGDIVHALCGELQGEEAFYAIMTWRNGAFETLDGISDSNVSIKVNYQYLLLEAARLSDEANRTAEPETAAEPVAEVAAENSRLRVLMVEDSMIMAKIMATMLKVAGDIEIAGIANNGKEALEMMAILHFDLVMLDVNMPVMNGRITLKHIMIKSPCPVVIMSNVGSRAPETVLSLIDLGAVDFISKPVRGGDFVRQQQKIVERVRRAARANISAFRRFRLPRKSALPERRECGLQAARQLVVVSSGCSGHGALYRLIGGMTQESLYALVSLNAIPVTFLPSMSEHLGRLIRQQVIPLSAATSLHAGGVYMDIQKRSLLLQATGDSVSVSALRDEDDFEYGPGYFDLFLSSAADVFRERLLIILLSGAEIGNLDGLRYVREKGGTIFAQEQASCMIADFMPPVTQEKLIDKELKPAAIAGAVAVWLQELEFVLDWQIIGS